MRKSRETDLFDVESAAVKLQAGCFILINLKSCDRVGRECVSASVCVVCVCMRASVSYIAVVGSGEDGNDSWNARGLVDHVHLVPTIIATIDANRKRAPPPTPSSLEGNFLLFRKIQTTSSTNKGYTV